MKNQNFQNMNSRTNRRNRKRQRNKTDPVLLMRPAFKGQPNATLKIVSDFAKVTTTVTTGTIQQVVTISVSAITNFAARFVGFEEYRIIKATLRMNCFSSTNPGRIVAYVDPDDNSNPTLPLSLAHRNITFGASDVMSRKILEYVPHDPSKQQFQTVATGTTAIGYFKIYTNNSSLGASTVATDYLGYDMEYVVQFRGFVG